MTAAPVPVVTAPVAMAPVAMAPVVTALVVTALAATQTSTTVAQGLPTATAAIATRDLVIARKGKEVSSGLYGHLASSGM